MKRVVPLFVLSCAFTAPWSQSAPPPANNSALIQVPSADPVLLQRDRDLVAVASTEGIDAARRFIERRYPAAERQHALAYLMGELGKQDLRHIILLYKSFTEKRERWHGLGVAAGEWAKKDANRLLEFIEKETSDVLKTELYSCAISSFAHLGLWEVGTKALQQMPPSPQRKNALIEFGRAFGRRDPIAAAKWAASYPSENDRRDAENGIITGLEFPGDLRALEQILPTFSPLARGNAKELYGKLAIKQGKDLTQLLESQKGQPGTTTPVFLGAIRAASEEQLNSWLPMMKTIANEIDRSRVYAGAVSRLFSLGREKAIRLALSLGEKEREFAIPALVRTWYTSDPQSLVDWAKGLPAGSDQDLAFTTIIPFLRGKDAALANDFAGRISNPTKRQSALKMLP